MKVSDFIVKLLEKHSVCDMFGYPGVGCGHLMDSLKKSAISNHLVYNEQGAAFAACAYAQASHKTGIAYSTAGPGGTNLITGIANAYCDSIPTIFIIGEKDLSSLRGKRKLRQRTSQEIDIVSVCKPITKWSVQIKNKQDVKYIFEKAFYLAEHGRPGPIVIDFPSDIQRDSVEEENLISYVPRRNKKCKNDVVNIVSLLEKSTSPLILVGNGIKQLNYSEMILEFAKKHFIPIVTSLVCCEVYAEEELNLGYIGLDGDKAANAAVKKCDLLISLGSRLNFKQVSNNRKSFAPNAKIIRIDCDQNELDYNLRDELTINKDLRWLVPELVSATFTKKYNKWFEYCAQLKKESFRIEPLNRIAGYVVANISKKITSNYCIVTDTGSHRRWVMSSFAFKKGQMFFQSAGLASMGYAVPASIGAYFASKKNVICFEGDGGLMMNLQELEMINRDKIPITIIVFNNHCLGDIMEFQKRVFNSYFLTTELSGYKVANFELIAKAFCLEYQRIEKEEEIKDVLLDSNNPRLIEIIVPSNTGENQ